MNDDDERREREANHFQRRISAFVERYATYDRRDFEYELRILIMLAVDQAQRPFIFELNTYRKAALDRSMIEPSIAKKTGDSE